MTAIAEKLLKTLDDRLHDISEKVNEVACFANDAKNGRHYSLGDGTILTTIYSGQIIAVDQSDLSLAPHLILKGEWEKELTQKCESIVHDLESPVIFDIGANFGWYGLTLSRYSSKSTVHFFEANPEIIQLLEKTVLVNGLPLRSKINNLAVSDKSGQILHLDVLKHHKGSSTTCGFSQDLTKFYENRDEMSHFDVSSISIDDYCKSNSISAIDFMKIDVEGAEEKVVKGAKGIIEASKELNIMLEWNIGAYTDDMIEILKAFKSCHGMDGGGRWIDLSSELREAHTVLGFEELISSRLSIIRSHHDLFFGKSDKI